MSEYVRKQALLDRINTIRNAHIEKRNEGDECDQFANEAVADWLWAIQDEIQSGAFDAPDGEVQRLRAIEQAIRDFQPTTEQQAGYDALVAWLESTTPFVLEPIEALSGAQEKEDPNHDT